MNTSFKPKSDASSWTKDISKSDNLKSDNDVGNSNRKEIVSKSAKTLDEE